MAEKPGQEFLLEWFQVGNSVKVSAIDPETGTEISIVGDPAAGEEALKQAAVNKLLYVLRKQREG